MIVPNLSGITSSTGKALVTGITGQDGSYLEEFLLGKGYEVYGVAQLPPHLHHELNVNSHARHFCEPSSLNPFTTDD